MLRESNLRFCRQEMIPALFFWYLSCFVGVKGKTLEAAWAFHTGLLAGSPWVNR